ncbi:MAG: flagellar motor protein MotB [Candidatus Aureabacteria bacterium]|nr:flagellar motor protein MotB [Candidatus Auribacterota bacterium]
MAKKQKCPTPKKGAPAWMVTYGDLMSLLLTFFVLIVSFSSIQEVEFAKAMGSLKGALGSLNLPKTELKLLRRDEPRPLSTFFRFVRKAEITSRTEQKLQYDVKEYNQRVELLDYVEEITTYAQKMGISDRVTTDFTEEGFLISMPSEFLFESGSAEVKTEAYPFLRKVSALLKRIDYAIQVEGHTDDRSISNEKFPSNWELSASRAVAVVKLLTRMGIPPERLSAVGYGEFQPKFSNETEEGRQKNRRVEMKIDLSR